ncbi:hypothetical protein Sango_1869500 [Sesamum angolense]|uniref:Uncharacterized protein n=1 Tax=Sesamum angolense TaxID=2727404 RepID=A0AAE1WIU8_9LAMI|nr:hypothetical protein Sango_1869500 [Sesamum angolense]
MNATSFFLSRRCEVLLHEESSEATLQATVASSSVSMVPSENISILWRLISMSQSPERYDLLVICQLDNDPKIYEEVISDINSGNWLETMRSKIDPMRSNKDQDEQLRYQPSPSPMQAAPQTPNLGMSLEDIVKSLTLTTLQFQQDTMARLQETRACLQLLGNQISQLATSIRKLEAQASQQTEVNAEKASAMTPQTKKELHMIEQAPIKAKKDETLEDHKAHNENVESDLIQVLSSHICALPSPYRMSKSKDDEKKILSNLNKVKINIPLIELKALPYHLQCFYLGVSETLSTIISQGLLKEQNDLKLDAREVLRSSKEKTKWFTDFMILRKLFEVGKKVLFYKVRLKLISGKSSSSWLGHFEAANVFPHGVARIKSLATRKFFKVKGHRSKPFLGGTFSISFTFHSLAMCGIFMHTLRTITTVRRGCSVEATTTAVATATFVETTNHNHHAVPTAVAAIAVTITIDATTAGVIPLPTMVRPRAKGSQREKPSVASPSQAVAVSTAAPPPSVSSSAPSNSTSAPSNIEPLRDTYCKRSRFNTSTGIPPTAERELEGYLTFTTREHKKRYSVIKTRPHNPAMGFVHDEYLATQTYRESLIDYGPFDPIFCVENTSLRYSDLSPESIKRSMIHKVHVNLGAWLASQFQTVAKSSKNLCLGHLITHLAVNLGILNLNRHDLHVACEEEPLDVACLHWMHIFYHHQAPSGIGYADLNPEERLDCRARPPQSDPREDTGIRLNNLERFVVWLHHKLDAVLTKLGGPIPPPPGV